MQLATPPEELPKQQAPALYQTEALGAPVGTTAHSSAHPPIEHALAPKVVDPEL